MKCPKCGNQIPEGEKFCGKCGFKLPEYILVCPKCHKGYNDNRTYCGECGEKLTNVVKTVTAANQPSAEERKKNRKINIIALSVIAGMLLIPLIAFLIVGLVKDIQQHDTSKVGSFVVVTKPKTTTFAEKPKSTEKETQKPTQVPTTEQPTTEKPTEKEAEPTTEAKKETIIFNNMGITVTCTGVEYNSFKNFVNLRIENNSGHDYTFQLRDVSVNGYMITPVFSCDVKDGKIANHNVTFMQSDFDKNGIKEIENIELSIHAFNWNDHSNDFDSEMISFNP